MNLIDIVNNGMRFLKSSRFFIENGKTQEKKRSIAISNQGIMITNEIDKVVVDFILIGYRKRDINFNLKGDVLIVSTKRGIENQSSKILKKILLPEKFYNPKIKRSFTNDILTIKIYKESYKLRKTA